VEQVNKKLEQTNADLEKKSRYVIILVSYPQRIYSVLYLPSIGNALYHPKESLTRSITIFYSCLELPSMGTPVIIPGSPQPCQIVNSYTHKNQCT
jgi:hypothetical protein